MKMSLDQVRIIVIGDRVWGKGLTIKEALDKADRPRAWQAFICHESTTLDAMGFVNYPKGCPPREIDSRGLKAGKKFFRGGMSHDEED